MLLTIKHLMGERLWVAAYHASIKGDAEAKPLVKEEALKITRADGFWESLMAKYNYVYESNAKETRWTCANPERQDIPPMEGSCKREAFSRCLAATVYGEQVNYPFAMRSGAAAVYDEDAENKMMELADSEPTIEEEEVS